MVGDEFEIVSDREINCWNQYQKQTVDRFSAISITLMIYLWSAISLKSRQTTTGAVERDFQKIRNNPKHVTNIFHINLKAA